MPETPRRNSVTTQSFAGPAFPASDRYGTPSSRAAQQTLRRSGIEFEHIIMHWDTLFAPICFPTWLLPSASGFPRPPFVPSIYRR